MVGLLCHLCVARLIRDIDFYEFESVKDNLSRDHLFADLVKKLYDRGKTREAASFLEIDAVIDPSESRLIITKAFKN